MPTLNWIGKEAVVNHHHKVPYRLLSCDPELSAGDPDAGNLLGEGDNLEALKALLPYYAEDGAIFVSIDDTEVRFLRTVRDEGVVFRQIPCEIKVA